MINDYFEIKKDRIKQTDFKMNSTQFMLKQTKMAGQLSRKKKQNQKQTNTQIFKQTQIEYNLHNKNIKQKKNKMKIFEFANRIKYISFTNRYNI